MIKSQAGFGGWSTSALPKETRDAAEWLIKNGYQNNEDVKSAFARRETSCMADDVCSAMERDNAAINRLYEKYRSNRG